ncbi:AAA family ATPase [Priestia aryabhattai]|uniref:AAA family ATPase n=1 Tax=Priestia aryabhattai TaxID=412384 RepID=UPI001CD1EFF7|nr:AAA family ATPase [Priestia aryabhattai]MCA1049377.1 AAA family ATPase [Priestia aryabhattai]
MKIKNLYLQNFRCYKGEHHFKLDNQTTLLYGENGYGKSSFFDAIEWCLTGNIMRFTKSEEKSIDKKIILNRHAQYGDKCSVSLEIGSIILQRSFTIKDNPREIISIKDSSTTVAVQGKKNVDRYIRNQFGKKTSNGKILTSLIKQSHILSQDQITDFVLRDKPKDRFNSLADIMGYRQLLNLLENLKKVEDNLKNFSKKHQSNIATYDDLMKSKSKDKKEFDIYEVHNLLHELNIDLNNSNPRSELNHQKEQKINDRVTLEGKLNVLENLNDFELSYSHIENFMKDSQKHIAQANENGNRIAMLLSKNDKKINVISKRLGDISNQKKLFEEKQLLKEKINQLKSSFENVDMSSNYIEELDNQLKKEEIKQQKLLYAKSHQANYKSYQKEKSLYPFKVNSIELNIQKASRRLEKFNVYLNKLKDLLESEDQLTSINSLNNAIQEIYSYVLKNNVSGVCPVCSTVKGEHLSVAILENIQNNLSLISTNSKKITKINKIIKRLQNKIESLSKDIQNLESDKKNLEMNLLIIEKNILKVKKDYLYSEQLFSVEASEVEKKLEESFKTVETLNNNKIKFFEINSLLNQLESFSEVNFKSRDDVETSLVKRKRQLDQRKNMLQIFKQQQESNKRLNERKYKEEHEKLLSLTKIIKPGEVSLPLSIVRKEIQKDFQNLNEKISKIDLALEYHSKLQENLHIENDLKELQNKIEIEKSKLDDYEKKIGDISSFREKIYLQIGDKASDLLNKPNSSIQKYFRYLNPLPGNNNILFNSPNSEELEIVLSYNEQGEGKEDLPSVQYSMSSGQLYVLAISIFLAINEAQDVSEFDFVGIDDPIQNMDDVNQFSICDVLSSIEKQLIFSTHDFNFLKLYLKKNEHRKNSIKVFILKNDDNSVTEVQEVNFNEGKEKF